MAMAKAGVGWQLQDDARRRPERLVVLLLLLLLPLLLLFLLPRCGGCLADAVVQGDQVCISVNGEGHSRCYGCRGVFIVARQGSCQAMVCLVIAGEQACCFHGISGSREGVIEVQVACCSVVEEGASFLSRYALDRETL